VNVSITDISETRKTLTVTLDKGEVDGEYNAILGEFTKQVSLPGFRPGKAPAAMVAKRYGKELGEEFKTRVVGRAYRDGLKESKLDAISLVEVEEGQVQPGLSAAIKLTIDVRPVIKLPEYKGIETTIQPTEPTAKEIDAVVEGLRGDRADFKAVERPAQKGDFVRFGYEGTLDGKPLAEVVADKPLYAKAPQTWEEVEGENEGLLPGMGKLLAGLKVGDKKTVTVNFPAEYPAAPALAGKAAAYALEILEVRERTLAALDEKFFKDNNVASLDELKEQIKKTLTYRKEQENRSAQRRQVTDALVARANFPVPDSLVASERDGVLRNFIEENMRRGVAQEEFEKNKKELFDSASKAALARVKVQLTLAKIAEAEKIAVDEKDVNNWIMREAMRSGQKPDKLVKELGQDREQMRAMQQQILFDKTLDLLVSQATVRTATANA
jgi:trigger factor